MVKSKKQKRISFKWWYIPILIIILYIGWIALALADVNGNPFGVNSGKIETYISVINMTGNSAEQYVESYKVSGSEDYELIMGWIERDFENLDEYESKLERYGVGDREDIVWKLKTARLQLETAKRQIMNLAGTS